MAGLQQDIDYEVAEFLDKRITDLGNTEYLVRWKGFSSEWDTWEPADNLGNCHQKIKKFEKSIALNKQGKQSRKFSQINLLNDTDANSGINYHKNLSLKQTNKENANADTFINGMVKISKSNARKRESVKNRPSVKDQLTSKFKKKRSDELRIRSDSIEIDSEVSFCLVKDKPVEEGSMPNRTPSEASRPSASRKSKGKVKMSSPKTKDIWEDVFKAVLNPKRTDDKQTKRRKGMTSVKLVTKKGVVKKQYGKLKVNKTIFAPKTKTSKSSIKAVLNLPAPKIVKSNQGKRNSKDNDTADSTRKRRSPQAAKANVHAQPANEKIREKSKLDELYQIKDTSKIDELYNHLLEQVRAATPPHKPSKHKVTGVKAGKSKAPSPKSRETKDNSQDLNGVSMQSKKVGTTAKGTDKSETNRKSEKSASARKSDKSRTKSIAGHKRKAVNSVTIETDNDSSDDGVLYSLSDVDESDSTPSQSPEAVGKGGKYRPISGKMVGKEQKAVVRVKKISRPEKSLSDTGTDQSEKSKKIRLLDSLKKPGAVKPVRPVSPTPLFTTVKTATVMPTTARRNNFSGGIPMYQYVIQPSAAVPVSPTSMSYKMLLENLPHQLHPKKNKKQSQEEGEEDVERRMSVRASECAFKYKEIIIKKCHKYTQIWLYTHTKMKNALNPQVIQELQLALNAAKYDNSNLVMLSGLDNVFCSGIDLHFLLSGDKTVAARQMADALRDFTKTLITFPKLIVAVVTGPAIGLGMTMLPLCDVVYASDKASFFLPYAQLAQTPEGCASYTLPQALGMAMANELLIGGRKITAIEACQLGLVSQVHWPTSMMQEVIPKVQNMAQSSGKVLETTKLLIRSHQRTKLDLTNESESNLLLERWSSTECQKAITEFLNDERNYTF